MLQKNTTAAPTPTSAQQRNKRPSESCSPAQQSSGEGLGVNPSPRLGGEQETLQPNLVSVKENQAVVVDTTVCFQSKYVPSDASIRSTKTTNKPTEEKCD